MGGPVRFPARAKSPFLVTSGRHFLGFLHMLGHVGRHFGDTFWSGRGHFLVGSGSLFREFWDVLGCVWEWFGDVFGWVWEGLGKISDGVGK